MILNLKVEERLAFGLLYPKQDDLDTMTYAKDIRDRIVLTPEEKAWVKLKVVNGAYEWNKEADKGVDIDFTIEEMAFLKNRVKVINKEKKVEMPIVSLCHKINNMRG